MVLSPKDVECVFSKINKRRNVIKSGEGGISSAEEFMNFPENALPCNELTNFPGLELTAEQIVEEFNKLLTAINQLDKAIGAEMISSLVYPCFFHCYLACTQRCIKVASEFFHEYHSVIERQSDACEVCEALLTQISKPANNNNSTPNPQLQVLYNVKIKRNLTETAFLKLEAFLTSDTSLRFLPHILTHKFLFNISQSECPQSSGSTISESRISTKYDKLLVKSHEIIPTVLIHKCDCNFAQMACGDMLWPLVATGHCDSAIRVSNMQSPSARSLKTSQKDDSSFQSETNIPPSTVTLRGHCKTVNCIRFAKTLPYLLSSGLDNTVRLWDLNHSECKVKYMGHSFPVWAVSLASDDSYFASGGMDSTCKLWMFERTYPLRVFARHSSDVNGISFHPNGTYLGTVGDDNLCIMWSINDGNYVRLFTESSSPVCCVKFAPNGHYIAAGNKSGKMHIYDIRTSAVLSTFELPDNRAILSLDFTSDSHVIAFGGNSDQLMLNNVETGQSITSIKHTCQNILSMTYSSDDLLNLVGSLTKTS